jgi:hypothetical protein
MTLTSVAAEGFCARHLADRVGQTWGEWALSMSDEVLL